MKKIITLANVMAVLAIGYLIAACQTTNTNTSATTSQKETLLAEAGFKAKTVTTPMQKEKLSQLAENKVSAVKYKRKLYYVYPTAKKDQILVGRQAQFDAYKKTLESWRTSQQANQQAQMAAGSPVWVGETAGPDHITVETFDDFGPLDPVQD